MFDPDLIVVMDLTLLDSSGAKVTDGIRYKGAIFLNSPAHQAIEQLHSLPSEIRVVNYNLTDAAMEILGRPIISSASAAAAARLLGLVKESSLEQAIVSELEEIGLDEDAIKKNVVLGRKIFSSLEPVELNTEDAEDKLSLAPLQTIIEDSGLEDITSAGNSDIAKTGSWRIFKPIVDYAKCTACTVCYAYCPESALKLREDGKPEIDYDNCKGCLICFRECPPKAIKIEREVIAF